MKCIACKRETAVEDQAFGPACLEVRRIAKIAGAARAKAETALQAKDLGRIVVQDELSKSKVGAEKKR